MNTPFSMQNLVSNTKKALLALALITIFTIPSAAQSYFISGKITGNGGEALTGAVAELRSSVDSTLARVSVADATGIYKLENVKAGSYYIRTSFLGYNPHFTASFAFKAEKSLEMPAIKMEQSAVQLKQAEVSAFRPLIEVKPDKTVFNVESSISATGSTAYELLQKAPGVVVDNNDNITLKGRGGVVVQIDGKDSRLSEEELANYLKNIQSTDVEAIEIISNPSSKYDAAGTGGMINVKLRKNKNFGTNGSLTAGYAYGRYSRFNTALSLNSRVEKLSIFSSYSNNWGDRQNEFYLYREQNPYIYNQSAINIRGGLNHNFKAGADYTINKKHSMGIMANGSISRINGEQDSRNRISGFTSGVLDSILLSDQTYRNKSNNINLNLNHHFSDTLGHDLVTDADFGYYNSDKNTYIPNIFVLPDGFTPLSSSFFRSVTPTVIRIYSLKSDYSQNLWKGRLGAGYKAATVHTDNTFNFYNIIDNTELLDDSRSNHFVYTENIIAGYVNYNRTFGKVELQGGLRMENTGSKGDLKSANAITDNKVVERNYTDFFPSGGITYNPHKDHSLGLVYSSRIDRPNYQELNPFEYKLDELSYRKGNPFLNPQYSNKLELSHTYKYTTTTSAGYSHTYDFFAQIADTMEGGKGILMPRNLATEDVFSVNVSVSRQPVKWFSIYLNAGVYHQAYKADFGNNKTINTAFSTFNFYGQTTFKLPYNFTFELSGWYNSGGVWGGAFKNDGQGAMDAGLQKKLFDDQATLKLTVTDVFYTAPWNSYNTYAGIVIRAHGNWESRQFRLSLTWRFGNKQVKGMKQRSSGSETEIKRIEGGDN